MKVARLTEAQIMGVLKEQEACADSRSGSQAYPRRRFTKAKFGGMEVSGAKRKALRRRTRS